MAAPKLILFLSLFPGLITSQVLNGSFENINVAPCTSNLPNGSWTGMITDFEAFGTASQLDAYANFGNCGFGTAQDGNWFMGMAVDITNSLNDAFSLTLGAPLNPGSTYLLSFYDRKDPNYGTNLIEVGLSNASGSFGTSLYTTPSPAVNTWTQRTYTFTAQSAAQYLTVRTVIGSYGWTFVDNFTLTEVTSVPETVAFELRLYPIPAADLLYISGLPAEELSCRFTDLTGKTLFSIVISGPDPVRIPLDGQLKPGVYIFHINFESGIRTIRFLKQ